LAAPSGPDAPFGHGAFPSAKQSVYSPAPFRTSRNPSLRCAAVPSVVSFSLSRLAWFRRTAPSTAPFGPVSFTEKLSPVCGVHRLSVTPGLLSLAAGTSEKLTATVLPPDATNKEVTWTSNKPSIATVWEDGTVRGVAAGEATITAKAGDISVTCTVTVTAATEVTGVSLNKTTLSLNIGQSEQLSATVTPNDATDKSVTWSTSDTNIAIVNQGLVTGVAAGTATITAKAGSKTATCSVTVVSSSVVTGVTLSVNTLNLAVGANGQLTATVQPSNAANKSVTWTTSDSSIATVTQDGLVKGVAAGTATITVTSTADSNKTATCEVTVTAVAISLIDMVKINGGTFTMGSPSVPPNDEDGRYDDEGPQHQVTLSAFYMGKYTVTQGQWLEVMGTNVQQQSGIHTPAPYFPGDGPNYPMYYVNWYEALVFCNKLSMEEGLSPAYSISGSTNPSDWGTVPSYSYRDTSNQSKWNTVTVVNGSTGYRLPTEAQWEYACRAGTTTPFNTGDTIYTITTEKANYDDGYADALKVVDSYQPNAWGLYQMHGNVDEWCWDWYGPYTSAAQTNPTGPSSSSDMVRVIRGGDFNNFVRMARSARRDAMLPRNGDPQMGFRVVRP